ncbi:hypothetical protein NEOLEDRAFT_1052092, partial [Neolentinus lepideus HHB14362 ss-1]
HIPRPKNAFILFRCDYVKRRTKSKSGDGASVSKRAGEEWRKLPASEKARYHARAEEEKRRHRIRYPDYAYKPQR